MPVNPPQTPIVRFLSPNKDDRELIEIYSAEIASYQPLDVGTPHPQTREYPGFRFAAQIALPNDHRYIQRIFVLDESGPDSWNYAERFSAESNAHPIFVRNYREDRKTYAPRTKNTALQTVYKLAITNPGEGYIPGSFPALTFSGGGGGTGAAGHAVVHPDRTIAELIIDNGGSGYTSAPTFTIEAPPAGGTTATGTAFIQPTGAVLVAEEAQEFPPDSEFFGLYLNVVRVYETLPGPYIPFTRYDENLGPIQGKRRAVLNTNQAAAVTATTKTTYEGRDGSSIVSWEITETWSNGSGTGGNPAYPIGITDFNDPARGPVHQVSQITTDTTSPGSSSVSGSTVTTIRYEPYQDNPSLRKKIVETWTVPRALAGKDTNQVKQVVSVTETRKAPGSDATPTATKDVTVENKGDGTVLQTEREVPTVFSADEFTSEVPDIVPERFRVAVPTEETREDIEGTAAAPTMGAGDLRRSETQLNNFIKRLYRRFRSLVGLPVALVSTETNQAKQVVTITQTLKTAGGDATPTATKDVKVDNLGDGTVLQTEEDVPEVFDDGAYEKSIPDALPEEFGVLAPITITEVTSAGTADTTPDLGTGDLRVRESQVKKFIKRVVRVTRAAVSLPATLTESGFYEGLITVVTKTYDNGVQSVSSGLTTIRAFVRNLGNNTSVKLTETVASYPPRPGQEYDADLDAIIEYTIDRVALGSGIGAAHAEIRPVSFVAADKKVYNISAINSALASYMVEFPGTANINFPDELVAIDSIIDESHGSGNYSESGNFEVTDDSGASMSLKGNAHGSASVSPAVSPVVRRKWGNNRPVTHYLFFVPNGTPPASRLPGVQEWPEFNPQTASIFCIGQRASAQAQVASFVALHRSSGGSSVAGSSGSGTSYEVATTITAVRIPQAICAGVSVSGATVEAQQVNATASIGGSGILNAQANAEDLTVTGKISPTFVNATPGANTTDDLSGDYLLDIDCAPYKWGHIRCHATVVNL